jgi:hypothetical protein
MQRESATEKNILEDLLEDMLNSNEAVKEVTVRFYLHAHSRKEVRDQANKINEDLSYRGYKAAFFLGEEETEWRALFTSQTTQKETIKRQGKELTTTDLGASYFLNHSQLIDERGQYLGYTNTGGLVIFDPFKKDKQRLSYNFILLGKPGSGKSSTFKKIGSNNHILGNYTYYFVVSKEYDSTMKKLGGLSIDASGSNGTSNPFQVFTVIIDEDTNTVDEANSYSVTLNKIVVMFSNMYGEVDRDMQSDLSKKLDDFYRKYCKQHNLDMKKITQYDAKDYPLLEDFIRYIDNILYLSDGSFNTSLTEYEQSSLRRISNTGHTMIKQHGQMFNRHTTIDLEGTRSVAFNLEKLLNTGKNVFNAQFYNLLFLIWNISMRRGMREKFLVDTNQKNEIDAIRTMLLIDEFHNITRQENQDAIDILDRYDRENRKAFGGFGLATHDISDVVPSSATNEYRETVLKLFRLSTYKFIMLQDASTKPMLRSVFGETLTERELDTVPLLKEGEVLLSISGKGNYQLKIDLSAEEKRLFTGGL